jgi:hypothetical protein
MFIPRHPVVENQFCSFGAQTDTTTGVGGVLCYAGAVLYLDPTATNEEAIVSAYGAYSAGGYEEPFGLSMQKVKTGYHQVHPTGYMMPGDLGSSDVIAQPSYSSGAINGTKAAPLGVAHLGIWDTVHYTCAHTSGTITAGSEMDPGDKLYVAANADSRVTNSSTVSTDTTNDGDCISAAALYQVGRVVKGASKAKCEANIANTTLYPVRIKLFI